MSALGAGVAGLVNAHDPDLVTLGGLAVPLRAAAPAAFDTAYMDGLMHFRRTQPPPVLDALHGDDGALHGAIAVGLDHVTSESALAGWADLPHVRTRLNDLGLAVQPVYGRETRSSGPGKNRGTPSSLGGPGWIVVVRPCGGGVSPHPERGRKCTCSDQNDLRSVWVGSRGGGCGEGGGGGEMAVGGSRVRSAIVGGRAARGLFP